MATVIFNPLEEYDRNLRQLHTEKAVGFFDELVKKSGIDIEKNRETVRLYNEYKQNLARLKKKRNRLRFWRVLMCITLVLIPLVITKMTPQIRALKADMEKADQRADALFAEASNQMRPLNALFTDRDALDIIEATLPQLSFHGRLSVEQEADMRINYDFVELQEAELSTIDLLAGHYNENPFLFENKRIHTMGTETYHGYKTIRWTETYRNNEGKICTRTKTETLHATVTKPKPFFHTRVVLNYCAQGGPDLCFSRDASHLEQKNEKELERFLKRGEKKLQKKADKAVGDDHGFTSMSNAEFEVLFDALDRNNEVQFRTLFTPLAQNNMAELILSKVGYGDDFTFVKTKRTNRIVSTHSQGRAINLLPGEYISHAFDEIRENFVNKNAAYFKAVYFDLAPLLAIPLYQERPAQSLKPIPSNEQLYAQKECEALANMMDLRYAAHPQSKTPAILKTSFVHSKDSIDETCITAYSYDIEKRVDIVSVRGGDDQYHDVSVEWDEYLPLEASNHFFISTDEMAAGRTVIAKRNGLCIFQA